MSVKIRIQNNVATLLNAETGEVLATLPSCSISHNEFGTDALVQISVQEVEFISDATGIVAYSEPEDYYGNSSR